jgi:choloylglycine hydrolase
MKLIIFSLSILVISCFGCSDFQLKPADGSIICARAMDFIMPMNSQILVFNRGTNMTSKASDGSNGLEWVSRYGFIGINAFGIEDVDEGMNEKGLTCGLLVLKGTEYPPIISNENNTSIAIMDVCTWILGSFSKIKEVKEGIKSVRIWGNKMPVLKTTLGLHIAIHDISGNNLVIEFLNGIVNLYDNPLGILTNEPPLLYQLQNLVLYNELSPNNTPNITINGYKITSLEGSGMYGIPGSWSSIDRFVRISSLVRYVINLENALDGVLAATYILNSVYTPTGIVSVSLNNHKLYSNTQWASIKDLTNNIFYYRNNDGAIRAIYLNDINFSKNTKHTPFPVQQSNPLIIDETQHLNI